MTKRNVSGRGGFTLIEILAVVMILTVVAVMAVSRVGTLGARAKTVAAEADLAAISAAILDGESGYVRDLGGIPGFHPSEMRLANLLIATNLYGLAETEADAAAGTWPRGERIDDAGLGEKQGVAHPADFITWSATRDRGWRGPYVRHATGRFPARDGVRFAGDAPFAARGFFPDLSNLYLPDDFLDEKDGCSIYGFPGEPAILDPWGNPYVLQVPPPQAFSNDVAKVSPERRWRYARVVSAGADGVLETPCYGVNSTNVTTSIASARDRRLVRQAGRIDRDDCTARGDDLVLFLNRNDIDEGEDNE
jgi:prepilin-type N-terminal cleavage/methylation domain-containing protein